MCDVELCYKQCVLFVNFQAALGSSVVIVFSTVHNSFDLQASQRKVSRLISTSIMLLYLWNEVGKERAVHSMLSMTKDVLKVIYKIHLFSD